MAKGLPPYPGLGGMPKRRRKFCNREAANKSQERAQMLENASQNLLAEEQAARARLERSAEQSAADRAANERLAALAAKEQRAEQKVLTDALNARKKSRKAAVRAALEAQRLAVATRRAQRRAASKLLALEALLADARATALLAKQAEEAGRDAWEQSCSRHAERAVVVAAQCAAERAEAQLSRLAQFAGCADDGEACTQLLLQDGLLLRVDALWQSPQSPQSLHAEAAAARVLALEEELKATRETAAPPKAELARRRALARAEAGVARALNELNWWRERERDLVEGWFSRRRVRGGGFARAEAGSRYSRLYKQRHGVRCRRAVAAANLRLRAAEARVQACSLQATEARAAGALQAAEARAASCQQAADARAARRLRASEARQASSLRAAEARNASSLRAAETRAGYASIVCAAALSPTCAPPPGREAPKCTSCALWRPARRCPPPSCSMDDMGKLVSIN